MVPIVLHFQVEEVMMKYSGTMIDMKMSSSSRFATAQARLQPEYVIFWQMVNIENTLFRKRRALLIWSANRTFSESTVVIAEVTVIALVAGGRWSTYLRKGEGNKVAAAYEERTCTLNA